jgi:FixJ family two-component response regulator
MPTKPSIAIVADEASVRAAIAALLQVLGFIAVASSSADEFYLTSIARTSPPV